MFGRSGRDFSKLYFLQRGAAESKRHGLMWQDAAIEELLDQKVWKYIIHISVDRVNLVKTKKV